MPHNGCMSHYGMVPMHVTLWHGTNACHTVAWYQCISHYGMISMHVMAWYQCMSHYMAWYQWSHYDMVAIIVTVPMYVILWHETKYKIRHMYINCNICQHYTYGMASMHVTCTIICIMSLLMPWHNTTSVNTKTICVPLLTLMPSL